MLELNKIYQGDCIDVMKQMDENSVDAIITDPPYGLGFMGKEWDKFKDNNNWDSRSKAKRLYGAEEVK